MSTDVDIAADTSFESSAAHALAPTSGASTSPVALAVDLGGTAMKGAVVAEGGAVVAELTRPTPGSDILDALVTLFHDLRGIAGDAEVVGAGVATPGMLDEQHGIVHYASNLDWRDVPLLDILQRELRLPVAVGHDVRAAGLAERTFGAAQGSDDFVLVPIGTGVAAALVTAGGTITGATGAAGEFGHIPVIPGGEPCTCGQRGCLEVYMSGAGVARRYREAGGSPLSTRRIVARLGSDPLADRVWGEAVAVLAQGLTILTLLLDPKVIVLGGGVSHAGDALFGPLEHAVSAGLAWRERPEIVRSGLGGDAGRVGAGLLAFTAAR
ncbi:ROK family protein [Leifsonia shinshuensis]|uniref:ROK family protein n=1 Tax=Leifsonia shinshuensis TaxID=150026 RepID=A0A7G6YB00_9MICO|nr:ROK family protein [Leifsonia shinshuensis]QNE35665.1 ROK family protein [Leifsonia shinshuensis]